MARPKKKRTVCFVPSVREYGPINQSADTLNSVEMSVEELESIRLMDYENLGQETSAEVMGVARSTFQRIYNDARKKLHIVWCRVQSFILRVENISCAMILQVRDTVFLEMTRKVKDDIRY